MMTAVAVPSTCPGTQQALSKLILSSLTPPPLQATKGSSILHAFTGLEYVTIIYNIQKLSSMYHHKLPAQCVPGCLV